MVIDTAELYFSKSEYRFYAKYLSSSCSVKKFRWWETSSIVTANTIQNMQEYGFLLTRVLPYKDEIVQNWENILCRVIMYWTQLPPLSKGFTNSFIGPDITWRGWKMNLSSGSNCATLFLFSNSSLNIYQSFFFNLMIWFISTSAVAK